MLVRFTHYCTALIFLAALSVIYQNVVTPLMQPAQIESVALAEVPFQQRNELVSDLFAPDAWQRGTCKKLQTSDGVLLFQNWEQINDDQWKLWPVTVIIGRGLSGDTSRTPVIIDATEGADIKFAQSLDVMSGGAPPIHRGRMIGQVRIYRNGTQDDADTLDLRTANVGIDNRKIWTSEAISMKVGKAELEGRDLTIHLGSATTTGGDSGPAVLDRMELIYLDRLVMPLQQKALWQATDAKPADQQQPTQAFISVSCGGRVEYDFAVDQLLLNDSVSLVHQVPGQLADRFDCESIQMTLNDPTNDKVVRQSPMDWLLQIVATGKPAVAKLPSFDGELAADRIELDATAGLIRAGGNGGVRVRRGAINASLAGLVYQFDPRRPKSIEAIVAQGAGLVQVNDPNIPVRRAQWREGFELRPDATVEAGHLDSDVHLWIDGDFHAWLADGGEFQADSIRGVFKPSAPSNAGQSTTLLPDQFQVTGNVRIDTAAIAAETQRLDLFFVHDRNPKPEVTSNPSAVGSPLRQWVVQPGSVQRQVDPVARPRPTISGDSVVVELNQNEHGLTAHDLSVTGSVKISHRLKTGGQLLPARLTGDRLRLKDLGGEDVLQLESSGQQPARFELGDGYFLGPRIQVRPGDNTVWMNAAGEFQIPTAALPTGLAGAAKSRIQWTKPPLCRWQGEMVFDGHTAVLTNGVTMVASMLSGSDSWDLQMIGDRLQVDLQDGVQVRDMKAMRAASIQSISLMQSPERQVLVEAVRRTPDGAKESRHLIHAAQLSFLPVDGGTIVGDGPGWYRGWMTKKGNNSWFAAEDETSPASSEDRLTGIHLMFSDSMRADMMGKKLDFLRGVRIGVRSVATWDETFDAAAMDAISLGESTLDCDRLRFNIEPGTPRRAEFARRQLPTAWEMEAVSGVFFRTRNDRGLLEGTASRASYSSRKDLFTVEGAPGRAALFRQTLPDGSKGPEGQVRTMSIRPKTLKIETAVLERLNIGSRATSGQSGGPR